jgi:hypothetical protein
MDEYLWPARNVAEYAYCPRLFYFMEVEGIHLPSADTEQGVAVHKRVDRASAAKSDDGDPDKPHIARSLTLTSKSLGLTATLDLAEINGQTAVPVEYRKGDPGVATARRPTIPVKTSPRRQLSSLGPRIAFKLGFKPCFLRKLDSPYLKRSFITPL